MKALTLRGLFSSSMRVFALMMSAILVPTFAQSAEQWGMGASGTGTPPYRWGTALSNIVNRNQTDVRINVQSTAHFGETLALIAGKRMQLGIVSPELLDERTQFFGQFEEIAKKTGMPKAEVESYKDLRRTFNITVNIVWHFITRADAGIADYSGLKGKNVNLAAPASTIRLTNENLMKAYGLELSDFKSVQSMNTVQSVAAFQDRIIDYFVGISRQATELSQKMDIRLLPISDEKFEALKKLHRGTILRATIPANTFKGQTEPVPTYLGPIVLATHKDVDEKLVYSITKAFWENIGDLQKANSAFKDLTLENALEGSTTPLHPGAERYFREVGAIK